MINERKWQLLFGFYPSELYWRPTLALVLLLVAVAPVMFTALPRRMLWFSVLYPFIAYALIWGISAPGNETLSTHLGEVHSARIGGFLLVIIVAVIGIAASIPVGIVLELSRRSSPFAFGPICMAVIEVFRGVPPILLLFAASIILNYFLPPGTTFDLVLRVALVLALISGIYISEAIRANFAALPWGQYEAAAAMGLDYRSAMRLIIWPQVLNNSLPRIMIACTGLIRDISVLSIIGMIEPIHMLNVIRADADWNGIKCELYLAVALGYGLISYAISRYALYLDNRLDPAHRGRTWLDWR